MGEILRQSLQKK